MRPTDLFAYNSPAVTLVSESGLYALNLKSRKREAQQFRKWITSVCETLNNQTWRYEC